MLVQAQRVAGRNLPMSMLPHNGVNSGPLCPVVPWASGGCASDAVLREADTCTTGSDRDQRHGGHAAQVRILVAQWLRRRHGLRPTHKPAPRWTPLRPSFQTIILHLLSDHHRNTPQSLVFLSVPHFEVNSSSDWTVHSVRVDKQLVVQEQAVVLSANRSG